MRNSLSKQKNLRESDNKLTVLFWGNPIQQIVFLFSSEIQLVETALIPKTWKQKTAELQSPLLKKKNKYFKVVIIYQQAH